MKYTEEDIEADIKIRIARKEDALSVYKLVKACPPLDLNSPYCYLLLCTHGEKYCLTAHIAGELAGFVSAYPKPGQSSTLFVWQIAVSPNFRGKGIARQLLHRLVDAAVAEGFVSLETTVTPSNNLSRHLFMAITDDYGAECHESQFCPASLLGDNHEEEVLFKISPLKRRKEE